jgi:hypothetical protein
MHTDRVAHLVELLLIDLVEALVLLLALRLLDFRLWHLVRVVECFVSRCLLSYLLLGWAMFRLRFNCLSDVVCIVQRLLLLTLSLLPLITSNIRPNTAHPLFILLFLNRFEVFQAVRFIITDK